MKQDSYLISDGIHDEIISEEDWNLAQKKRQETGVGNEKVHSLDEANEIWEKQKTKEKPQKP